MPVAKTLMIGVGTALALALCGACGSDAPGAAETGAGASTSVGAGAGAGAGAGSGPGGPSCALAPSSLVSGSLGVPIGEPTQTVNSTVTVCMYPPTGGSGSVMVRFETGQSEAAFAMAKAGFTSSGQPTTDVPGLFDQAFSSTLGGGDIAVNTLVARRGSLDILVTSQASLDRERALVTSLFEAVG